MKKIKKYSCSVAVFIINILLVFVGYHFIKDNDKNTKILKEEENMEIQPIEQGILDAQNKIAADRENKLRDLNTAPKEIKQNQTTTKTTTTTPAKSTTKTKTS